MIDTERLTLRHLDPDADAEFVLRLLNEPSFLRHIGDRGVRTLDDARAYVANGPAASYARHGFGLYLVTRRADGAKVGICGLVKRDALEDVDVGFSLLPEHWSQGYALEAARAVAEHARRDCGLARLAGVVNPDNAASIRVLERLGMTLERTVRLADDAPEILLYARAL